jgi:hypothetical protein
MRWVSEISFLRTILPLEAKVRVNNRLFNNGVRTAKKTPHFTITKMKWFMLFKEIIAVYSVNQTKPRNTKCSVTDC